MAPTVSRVTAQESIKGVCFTDFATLNVLAYVASRLVKVIIMNKRVTMK